MSARDCGERDETDRRDRRACRGTMVTRGRRPKYTGPAAVAQEAAVAPDRVREETSGPAGR